MSTAILKFPTGGRAITLWDFQEQAVDDLRTSARKGNKRMLLQSATGSGKTVIAAEIVKLAVAKESRVLFLAHRRELISQCSRKLHQFGVDHGIIMAGRRLDLCELVQVGSIQTLWSRAIQREVMALPEIDLLVIDEAHRSMSNTYQKLIQSYPKAMILGLTATPCRTDGRGLGDIYQDMICCPSIGELTERGYLVPVKYFAPSTPDLQGVKVLAGDYVESQLGDHMDKPKLIGDVVEHWVKFGEGRRTVVFSPNIRTSQHLAERFQEAGYRFAHLDGKTPLDEREQLLADIDQGRLDGLCSCDVLCEGWDSPSVSCCVLYRPTKSLGRFLQMVGRVLRAYLGKEDCLLIDHAGAVMEHGFLDDPMPWALETSEKIQDRKEKKPRERLPIVCPKCFSIYSGQRICPSCGWEAPPATPVVEAEQGELAEVKDCRDLGLTEDQITWFRQFKGLARERKYHWKWIDHAYRDMFGADPHPRLRVLPGQRPSKALRDWVYQRTTEYCRRKERR